MALDTGGGRFIDPFVNPDGTPTRKLIFHATEGQGDPHQRGYMFAGTPLALLKKQSWARWAVMLEYFGIATPYLLWDSSEVAEPEDIAAALSFLGNVGKGRPGFLPSKLGTLKLTETPTGIDARGQHAAMLGCVNGELSKLIKAQSLSAEAGGSGSYALATVQSDSKEEVQVIDAALASDTWTHQFVVFLVEENLEELASAYGASPDQIRAVMPRAFRVVDRRLDPAVRLKLCLDYEAGGKNAGGAPRRAVDWDQVAEELCIPLTADEPADELPEPGPEQGAGAEPDAEPDDDLDSRLPSESEDED